MASKQSFKRIAGIDRSGGPDERTRSDQPWRPWTLPNFIGYARMLMIPLFLILAWDSETGRVAAANVAMLICGLGDYFDGMAARLTGQFSRLGTLLDPLIDRMLILAAGAVIYKFELLPRYLIVLIFVRELLMLVLSAVALRRGLELHVNWVGRLAVWPLMVGGYMALVVDTPVAGALVLIGVIGAYAATLLYVQSARASLRANPQPEVEA